MKRNPYKKGEGVTVQASMNKFWVDKLERGKNIEAYNQFLLTPIPVAPGMKVQKSNLFTMGFSKTKRKKKAVPTVGEPGSSSTLVTPKPVSSGCTNKVLGDICDFVTNSIGGSGVSFINNQAIATNGMLLQCIRSAIMSYNIFLESALSEYQKLVRKPRKSILRKDIDLNRGYKDAFV